MSTTETPFFHSIVGISPKGRRRFGINLSAAECADWRADFRENGYVQIASRTHDQRIMMDLSDPEKASLMFRFITFDVSEKPLLMEVAQAKWSIQSNPDGSATLFHGGVEVGGIMVNSIRNDVRQVVFGQDQDVDPVFVAGIQREYVAFGRNVETTGDESVGRSTIISSGISSGMADRVQIDLDEVPLLTRDEAFQTDSFHISGRTR